MPRGGALGGGRTPMVMFGYNTAWARVSQSCPWHRHTCLRVPLCYITACPSGVVRNRGWMDAGLVNFCTYPLQLGFGV
eukprot:364591-Chlamydomonas_euryale.AAC.1